jgi:hypothetical protein
MSHGQTMKCARCQQSLPDGSGFCVSCGHNNDAAMMQRAANVHLAADKRQARLGVWKRIVDALPFLRIFTR